LENINLHPNVHKSYFDTNSCKPALLEDARNVPKTSNMPLFGISSTAKAKNGKILTFDFCNSSQKVFTKIGKKKALFRPTAPILRQLIIFLETQRGLVDWDGLIRKFKAWDKQFTNESNFERIEPFLKYIRDDIGDQYPITYEDLIMLAFDLKKTGDWGQIFWVKNNKSDTLFYSQDRLASLFSIYCGNCTLGGFSEFVDPINNQGSYAFIYRGHGFTNGDPATFLSKKDGVRDYEQQISYLKHSMFLKRGRKDQFKPSVTAKDARLKREAKNEEIRKQRKEKRLQKRRMMDRYGQRGRGREPVIIQRRIAHDHHGMKADHISEWEEVSSHLQKNMKAIYTRLEQMRNDSRRSETALTHDDIVFFEGMYVLFHNMPYIFNLIPAFGKAFDIENTVIASDVRDVKIGVLKYVFSLPNEIQNQWSKEFQTHGEAFYDAWAEKIGSVCDEIYSAVYAD